jgi:methionine sulfoxide reductase heme-binding subunit
MTPPIAALFDSRADWYLTRGTGVVALLLATTVMVLGILGPLRLSLAPRYPRFALETIHRDLSLLTVAVIIAHVVVSVADGFAPIGLIDGIVPFHSRYRPIWLGLGALSFDLMLALIVTSLVRRRLGHMAWRTVHWLAYASWPLAVVHGLGTGTDTSELWMLGLTFICVMAVAVAASARVKSSTKIDRRWATAALAMIVAVPLALAGFAYVGPLSANWARRAGTPADLVTRVAPGAKAGSR